MHLHLKPTVLTKMAILKPRPRQRTAMAINTQEIIALGPEPTRRHARNILERREFVLRRLVSVVVGALDAVGAVAAEVVDVAHVDLLDAVDLALVVLQLGVDALAVAVARDAGDGDGGGVRGRWGGRDGCGGGHGGRGPGGGGGVHREDGVWDRWGACGGCWGWCWWWWLELKLRLRRRWRRLVYTDLSGTKKVSEFGGFICVLEVGQLSLEGDAFQESDVFYSGLVRQQIFEEPRVSVIVRAAKYDMTTMTVVEVEFENF